MPRLPLTPATLLLLALTAGCGPGAPGVSGDGAPEADVSSLPLPSPDTEAVGPGHWTAASVEGGPEPGAGTEVTDPPTVTGVRAARHPAFDRFVLEFAEPGGIPRFHLEYVDRPVRECGSGHVVALPGDGWLTVRLVGARAHDEDGRVTVEEREGTPGLPVILAHHLTCDFEGQVTWVLAVTSPNGYRVRTLGDPSRLVVDVQH